MRTPTTLALMAVPGALLAQANCVERDVVVYRLETGHGESFAGGGLQSSSRIIEVWASEDQGTWTILTTQTDGTSCIMASGTDWRKGLPQPEGVGLRSSGAGTLRLRAATRHPAPGFSIDCGSVGHSAR